MNSKIFIVEDEPIIAADLARILRKEGYEVVGIAGSKAKALDQIEVAEPDLVLLDINLAGEDEGIEIGTHLRENTEIQFAYITSYFDEKTVAKASMTKPLAYLLKPFREEELLINIGIALLKVQNRLLGMDKHLSEKNSIYLKTNTGMVNLPAHHIIFVQAEDNYTTFYSLKGKKLASSSLKVVEEVLTKFGFIRVHRSYLVNPIYIDTISDGHILIEQWKIPIGKTYRKELLNTLTIL